jgi:hypothetical protein
MNLLAVSLFTHNRVHDHCVLSYICSFGGYMMWAPCLLNGQKPWLPLVPCNHFTRGLQGITRLDRVAEFVLQLQTLRHGANQIWTLDISVGSSCYQMATGCEGAVP